MKYELYHHGIEGQKWGVRNGPPYPLERSFSQRVGEKRAKKRINYIEKNTKKQIASASLTKQLSSLKMEDLRKQANNILDSDERLESFGRRTIINRAAAFGAGHTAALGAAYVAAVASTPVVNVIAAVGGTAAVGASWIYYHYSTR